MISNRASTASQWLAAAALVVVSGCGLTDAQYCTEIGCNPGVNVEFSGSVPTDFTVEVRSEGSDPLVIECSPSSPCGSSVFAYGVVGDSVEVVITRGGDATTHVFFPVYEETRPNGPDCEPVCLIASIRVAFPS